MGFPGVISPTGWIPGALAALGRHVEALADAVGVSPDVTLGVVSSWKSQSPKICLENIWRFKAYISSIEGPQKGEKVVFFASMF